MHRTKNGAILSFFVGSYGYLVPRFKNDDVRVSKTIQSYLLGKRDLYYLYNLEKSLYGIRATLEVLEIMIDSEADILFINSLPIITKGFDKNISITSVKWKRGVLSKFKKANLVFLCDIMKENLVECHRECLLVAGVGGSTASRMSYLFNLNIEDILLSYWFFNAVSVICRRGKKKLKRDKKTPGFLGERSRGQSYNYAI
uniref:Ribosomal protein S2 n=2 Tax=Sargassum TaxID=3015 RepID=A0A8K1YNU9_9PHAE|nr:ribosomal protein S2 [Sargassum muticum]YP_010381302.1 ribosomal protein S2 [Sargassum kjellmanianum]UVW81834.1 ribosomal protein S2 [Sargassum siliquastrum]AIE46219.1 ribosomal protein S2 [Sargassum muticum]UDH59687.1 ribosomal protein S2 [Sargassum kjellmanianum]UQV81218.1 ribosomal protein S2 [Sargassum muticum]